MVLFFPHKTFQYAAFLFGFQVTKIKNLVGIAKNVTRKLRLL
ncbi:hypothetical protein M128_2642 [Bacteroides fragilis str. S6L8]|uniref:Uncharacterized protein n=2 Tax=Bacteroides fragilis TaxID=817 RepID=A0A016AIS0_BACFG|nr:hypothetical protein M101_2400 [Bacteroides fragilis str. 1007-1-F \